MSLSRIAVLLLACFGSALLGVGVALQVFAPGGGAAGGNFAGNSWNAPAVQLLDRPADFSGAAMQVTPAVVAVRTYLRPALTQTDQGPPLRKGSAVIISSDGYLATNNHVVEGAGEVRVTLPDRREYLARVVGTDASSDLALLKVATLADLPAVRFGDSDSLRVGEWVLAVGNPFGLTSTVTTGIVSAKGRSIDVLEAEDRIESFIQTDAAVNSGNSGGALVNTAGELIGINTAIITNSGRHEGYAFAIPGNLARRVLDDLRDYGEVQRAVLGVWVQGLNDAQARRLGLRDARGALVTDLTPGGPAARSGMAVGDVLRALNGVAVNSRAELQEQLSRYRPGQRIRLTYLRHRQPHRLTVLLRDKDNRPGGTLVSEDSDDRLHQLGFEVRGLTPTEQATTPDAGVHVMAIFRDTPVADSGLRPGFHITGVNGVPTPSLRAFLSVISQDGPLLLRGTYAASGQEYYYRIQ